VNKIFISDIMWTLFKVKLKLKDSPGYICSELVGKILVNLGFKIDKPLFLLKPSDIDKIIQDSGGGTIGKI
jgi:hypothetical protein